MSSRRPARYALTFTWALISLLALAQASWSEDSARDASQTTVEAGSLVVMEYTLTLDDGTEFDSNVGGEPLRFQQGAQQIIPGLDEAIVGMQVGQSKTVKVPPETGYGPIDPNAFRAVPVSELPEESRVAGAQVFTRDAAGNARPLRVDRLQGETAIVDFNHPLAGKNLRFDVKIVGVE